ncbi:FtsW/RodA/SpoVE family cell cycle protein [uncultured Eubacterium sp.]|uniref:FtsW/RodA/SpoVE family cell cycle protein n=1 Tax=uncultured Eubacterium sp. TaxID=165185 RepID=UPI0015BE55DB|nr:FtsW/RodA/SpoVE family cell cycle protein [uncultured Eubacterium sp.]
MSTTAIDTSGAGRKKNIWSLIKGTDFLTMFTALAASIYGLTLVYSASYSSLSDGKVISSDVRSMLVSVIGGFIISIILSNIDYDVISKLWPIVAAGCVGLMIFTYFFGVAPPSRPDSKCWIDLKIFYFQPSELMKVGFIISFSYHLDLVRDKINKIKTIIPLVIHGAIPVGLVILTGDAGSALIFLIMFIGMLFFARVNIGYFVAGFCAIFVGFAVAWKTGIINGIQRQRIVALFYPEQYADAMYQQTNGKIAIGSGGLFGQGFLQGNMTQSGAVPVNESDMVLTVAGEEFGFVGAVGALLILFFLVLRVMKIGIKARDNVGYLMCCGIAVMLFAQILVNVGMELSLLPCIGITLPLFSAGGSSSLCIYLALGIEYSVYRFSKMPRETLFYTK